MRRFHPRNAPYRPRRVIETQLDIESPTGTAAKRAESAPVCYKDLGHVEGRNVGPRRAGNRAPARGHETGRMDSNAGIRPPRLGARVTSRLASSHAAGDPTPTNTTASDRDARVDVRHGWVITIEGWVDDGIWNSESVAFRWKHELHQAMFVIRYDRVDRVARGGVRVFADHVILAEVSLAIPVQERTSPGRQVSSVIESRPLTHRRVFASYSHKDKPVVRQLAAAARALGRVYH